MLIPIIFFAFFSIIIIGIFVYGGNLVNTVFYSIDLNVSGQNFTEVYEDTLGQGINSFLNSADYWGIGLLFGMIILMIICAYSFATNKRIWVVVEFGILIVAFILAVIFQRSYSTVINSSSVLLGVYADQLTKSSTFILNLPYIIPIVWAIIIILTYSNLPRPKGRDDFEDIGA